MTASRRPKQVSLWSYMRSEVTRGYQLDADEERYRTRRQKMYTFMKIPRELEKFMSYGFFHCLDTFLFVFTFLPIRIMVAVVALIWRAVLVWLGIYRPNRNRALFPAEKIDLLKGLIIVTCVYALTFVNDTYLYHNIKSQSFMKLYLFYNMLEVGDRLFSAFGQDTLDALFWTATEPRSRKREAIWGIFPHILLAMSYVSLHTILFMLQATTLNVAMNGSNKALLTIMMSNNFVELKGSVFKKFDRNNLFQVSCSDVRERFHLFALLFVVVVQSMKEYGWREESFWSLAPDCLWVLGVEFFVDWVKHAFITRFNKVSTDVYKTYTTYLAYDLAQTKQENAFSDHSDLVSRRMGFIPLPLGVGMITVIGSAVKFSGVGALIIFALVYLCLVTFRILGSIVILGKACDLIDQHREETDNNCSKQGAPTSKKDNHAGGQEGVQNLSALPTENLNTCERANPSLDETDSSSSSNLDESSKEQTPVLPVASNTSLERAARSSSSEHEGQRAPLAEPVAVDEEASPQSTQRSRFSSSNTESELTSNGASPGESMSPLRARSLSSPDFMKQFRSASDDELDGIDDFNEDVLKVETIDDQVKYQQQG